MSSSNPVWADGPFTPEYTTLDKQVVPRWYLDGKFGIFIHWGVYAVPAFGNEWYPRNMYQKDQKEFAHHVKTYGEQSKFGYKDFIPMFKAEHFNPSAWAELFKQSGAKFVVPVAEHHDGFAMYKTKICKWNSVEMGPKRDVIGELSKAVRETGLTFGVSNHRIEHFWFFNGGRDFESDVKDPAFADLYGPAAPQHHPPTKEFMDDWLARCCELVDLYQPELFWFDWWIEQPEARHHIKKFAAYYYNRADEWGKQVAINYKNDAYNTAAGVLDIERGQMSDIKPYYWQNDTSVAKNSWGYIDGLDYKSSESLIGDLVDVVSKNGALLLNIGPRADGTIAQQDQTLLKEIGAWLSVNGEAIYGTRAWKVYGEGPTTTPEGGFTDTKRSSFSADDFRFTARGQRTLYVTCMGPVSGMVSITSLGSNLKLLSSEIENVELLGSDVPVKWTRGKSSLDVELPASLPTKYAPALRVTVKQPY